MSHNDTKIITIWFIDLWPSKKSVICKMLTKQPNVGHQSIFEICKHCTLCMASTDRKRTLVNWCRTVIETNPSEFRCRLFGYFPFSILLFGMGFENVLTTHSLLFTLSWAFACWFDFRMILRQSSNSKKTSMHENCLVHLWIMQITTEQNQ